MSDLTEAVLLKVLDRLESIEARLDAKIPPAPDDEEFPEYDEYPALTLVSDRVHPALDNVPIEAPEAPPTLKPMSPAQAAAQFAIPDTSGKLAGGIGNAKPPVSDMPVSLGSSSGHAMTREQLAASWQRDVVAQRRVPAIEDTAVGGA